MCCLRNLLNGKSKHKIPAPVVVLRFQHMEETHLNRRHFDLAAMLNWFGSEHLHYRFGCQEHHPQEGIKFESARYRISGRTDGQTDGQTDRQHVRLHKPALLYILSFK